MKTRVTESQLHQAVAELLDTILLRPALWTTFPAGWGKLGKATSGQLKASGLKAGFPDILLFHGGRVVGIELKAEDGLVSKKQTQMFLQLYEAGVRVYIAKTTDDVIGVLEQESLPHRKSNIGGTYGTPSWTTGRMADSQAPT